MNRNDFKAWLDLYGMAWKTRNPKLMPDLFDNDATYYEKPFESPLAGIDSITEYWETVAKTQDDVNFEYEILSVSDGKGIAHWKASFLRKEAQTQINLDGIMLVNLNSENKCTNFREWWQSKKIKQDSIN